MEDMQYQYQIYDLEQSAKEQKTIKIKICKNRKYSNMMGNTYQRLIYRGNMNRIKMNITD